MFAAIASVISSTVEIIGKAWEFIKEIKIVGRIASAAKCTAEWYAWLASFQLLIKRLSSIELPPKEIFELLGLSKIFGTKNLKDTEHKIANNLIALEKPIQSLRELTERAKMSKSPWAGTHKPTYNSIAIQEVLYDFSNVAGTGSMVIMFNPAGFGNKPRVPQIVRYVSEAEFSEFIHSKSWGNYWRINYLIGPRKRIKGRRSEHTSDILNENEYPLPKSEGLDNYVERVLEVPDYANDLVALEFEDLILEGLNKGIEQTEIMRKAIEKGQLGRGLEENGLRITSIFNDKIKEIPSHLKRIVQSNPIFKDAIKVTATYKKVLTRLRGLRDGFNDAKQLWNLSSEAILVAENFGNISLFGLEAATGEKLPKFNFLSETGLITNTAGKYSAYQAVDKKVQATIARNYGAGKTGQTYEKYLTKRDEYTRHMKKQNPNWEYKTEALDKATWEKQYAEKFENWKQELLEKELEALGVNPWKWKEIVKPPKCIPFFID